MHWLEMVVEFLGEFILNLAGICLDENRGRPRTVIGWLMLLLAVCVIAAIIFLFVRSLFFSK